LKYGISLGLALFVTWLLLSGHYTPFLLGLGTASVLLVLSIVRRMGLIDAESVPLDLGWRFPLYLPWLILEIAKSNFDVARRILTPGRSIQPTVIHVPANQRSELAQVIYANSITLTPGTVSIDVRRGEITVHALTREAVTELQSERMSRRVSSLEPD
jgi:multicomponent Na+:H+ antiporter subunit E